MEEKVESAEESGEENVDQNNPVFRSPLLCRAWKDEVDDSGEAEAGKASWGGDLQDQFVKVKILGLIVAFIV